MSEAPTGVLLSLHDRRRGANIPAPAARGPGPRLAAPVHAVRNNPARAGVNANTECSMTDGEKSRRFEEVALPHLDAAYNLARWLSGGASEAEDVVQEACLRAFRYFDGFRGGNARAWLLAIVRNTWYSEWSRRHDAATLVPFDDTMDDAGPLAGWSDGARSDPQALAMQRQDAERVHRALAALPVPLREVLVLRELEDMSYADIAMVAGIPVGTVMSRLSRGRRLLAAALRDGPPRPTSAAAGDVHAGVGAAPVRRREGQ